MVAGRSAARPGHPARCVRAGTLTPLSVSASYFTSLPFADALASQCVARVYYV